MLIVLFLIMDIIFPRKRYTFKSSVRNAGGQDFFSMERNDFPYKKSPKGGKYIMQFTKTSLPLFEREIRTAENCIHYCSYRNDPKFLDRYACANSADPDQTAPRGAV